MIAQSDLTLLPQYIRHNIPFYLNHFDYDAIDKQIEIYKMFLKPEASPGVPYSRVSLRNDMFLSKVGKRFNDTVIERLLAFHQIGLDNIKSMSRQECIDRGLMDPVRVFVKNEAHKISKIREGRVRLIMSVSIVDKMIEMLLARHLYKDEIANWRYIPSKPGIGFSDLDSQFFYHDVVSRGPQASSDMNGWDWSVQEWMILDEAEAVIKLCDNPSSFWVNLVRVKAWLETRSVYQFSDGTLVAPVYAGIMNSGKFKTSRGNSYQRARAASLIGATRSCCAGDDCIEDYVPNAPEKYSKFGLNCKVYDKIIDQFEFCSRIFTSKGSYPVNIEKMTMNLLHSQPKNIHELRMFLIGFVDEIRNHPDFVTVMDLISRVGYYEVEGPQIIVNNET